MLHPAYDRLMSPSEPYSNFAISFRGPCTTPKPSNRSYMSLTGTQVLAQASEGEDDKFKDGHSFTAAMYACVSFYISATMTYFKKAKEHVLKCLYYSHDLASIVLSELPSSTRPARTRRVVFLNGVLAGIIKPGPSTNC